MILKSLKQYIFFGREINNGILTLNDALEDQLNSKDAIVDYETKILRQKRKKALTFENALRLFKGRQKLLMVLKVKYFR